MHECQDAEVSELWKATARTGNKNIQIIAIKKNGTFKRSCRYQDNQGLVCAHYVAVFECSQTAKFHIGFVNPRWYINDFCLASAEAESTITATGNIDCSSATSVLIDALRASHDEPVWKQTSEQRSAAKRYAEMFGKCREATRLSCELKDNRLLHYLDELLSDLLQKKEELNHKTDIENFRESHADFSTSLETIGKENLNPNVDKLCNPPIVVTKGRPCKKRLPNAGLRETVNKKRQFQVSNVSNEQIHQEVKKQRNARHCSNCGSDKHNARTCQQK
jgi:hypothetical protein